MRAPAASQPHPKVSNLALQGGGAHGAFTWGVLDALLEDGRVSIPAISGASAGAMNAVVLAEGYLARGRDGAREYLHRFWLSVSEEGALSPVQRKLFNTWFTAVGLAAPMQFWLDALTHYSSPYEFNPLNLNPLRDHLAKMIDFEKLRATDNLKLFIAATNVHTGRGRIFTRGELTADHVMASACLPTLFQAVEINGEPYWDGGYVGNPPLWPLFYDNACKDTIIVQVNPIERNTTPRTALEIQNRLNEITFNGALLGELRAVNFVIRLIDQGSLSGKGYIRPNLHRIDGADKLKAFAADTKSDTSWSFLTMLRDLGKAAAREWLATNLDAIGVRGTLELSPRVGTDMKRWREQARTIKPWSRNKAANPRRAGESEFLHGLSRQASHHWRPAAARHKIVRDR
jgi:NTE family protein